MSLSFDRALTNKAIILLLALALLTAIVACAPSPTTAPTQAPAQATAAPTRPPAATTAPQPTAPPLTAALTGEIPIGVHWCLTGGAAYAGAPLLLGTQIAADEINGTGFLGNAKIKLVVVDDASDNTKAVSVAEKLVNQDKVVAIVGGCTSGAAQAATPVAAEAGVPWLVANAVAPGIAANKDPNNYVYRTSMPYTGLFEDLVRVVVPKLNIRSAAIIYMSDQASTVSFAQDYKKFFEAAGVKVVAYEAVLTADTDFSAVLTKIKDLKPDAVLPMNFGPQAAAIMLQARQLGITAHFLGQQGHNTPDMCKIGGKSVEGEILPATWILDEPNASNKHFVEVFRAKRNEAPDLFAANGYTGMWVMARAIKAAGKADRKAIRDALNNMKEVEVPLGDGKMVFDKDGEGKQSGVLLQITDTTTCRFDLWKPK